MLFVVHWLGSVRELCDRVATMHRGHLVEEGSIEQVFNAPRYPVTQGLLSDMPSLDLPR